MPLTVTCPSCTQMCQVADEHAGMQVRCPRCGNIITVPGGAPMAEIYAAPASPPPPPTPSYAPPPASAPPPTYSAPPPPQAMQSPMSPSPMPPGPTPPPFPQEQAAPPGPGALASLDAAARALGLNDLGKILVLSGWGCLVLVVLTVFLPWSEEYSSLGEQYIGRLGISTSQGLMTLLISLEVLFLLVFFFFLSKNSQMFQFALWAAGWWSIHLVIWRFVDIIHFGRHTQWGLYVQLVFCLGAAGTFGAVVLQRLSFRGS